MSGIQENFTIENGIKEIVILRGQAIKPHVPKSLKIDGILSAPVAYLNARLESNEEESKLNKFNCHLIVSQEKGTIMFVREERGKTTDVITGGLKESKVIENFGINKGTIYSDKALGKFFRMNKYYFSDPSVCNNIVSKLMNFTAKVNTIIEKNQNLQKGDNKTLYEKTVESDIPESFIINAPIFEGYESVAFEVFICAEANSSGVSFYLDSPILYELTNIHKKRIIEETIKPFEEFGCAIFYV